MPGRDITRLRNRAARVPLFTLVIWASLLMLAWSQSPAPQNDTNPATPPAATPPSATPVPAAPQTAPGKKDDQDKNLNDQGVFVFRKDVDEVLLHASVIDAKKHIVTTIAPNAFTVFEDGKPQNIISFHHEDIPVSMGILSDNSGSIREKRAKAN